MSSPRDQKNTRFRFSPIAVCISVLFLLFSYGTLAGISFVAASSAPLLVSKPSVLIQGEPFMVIAKGVGIEEIKRATFEGKQISSFLFRGKPTLLLGTDLQGKVGMYIVDVELADGVHLTKKISVGERRKYKAPLGIPPKLGGDTKEAQKKVVSTLGSENKVLASITSSAVPLWHESFAFPLAQAKVTDPYGYVRQTGAYEIAHKGVDFRAQIGTPVFSPNDGTVILVREFTVYGKTVVIDHGGGVTSLLMHLGEVKVREGERLSRGSFVGKSGESGYASSPHLHLSVRINGVSIDPQKFFSLLK